MTESLLFHEPEKEYHAHSKSGEVMSSHMLSTFAKCPFRYLSMIENPVDDDREAYRFGRAAHKFILEGEKAFDEEYAVSDGPVNPKTGETYGKATKAYREWAESMTREVVSEKDFEDILAMFESIRHNSPAIRLLARMDREAELVARVPWAGHMCQIRMDSFSPTAGIIDLKTCRELERFEYDMRDYGYVFQMAFYQDVLREVTGKTYPVHIIAVDKTPQHLCGTWLIPQDELDVASRVNRAAMKRFVEAKRTGCYPTGYENERVYCSDWRKGN